MLEYGLHLIPTGNITSLVSLHRSPNLAPDNVDIVIFHSKAVCFALIIDNSFSPCPNVVPSYGIWGSHLTVKYNARKKTKSDTLTDGVVVL